MAKPIFNSYIAKQLLHLGNKIVDLQPDRNREGAVIFYFELNDKLLKDLSSITKK